MKGFKIKILEIKTDEEIQNRFIKKFIKTNLDINGIKYSKKTKLYYSFFPRQKLYQIVLFDNKIPKQFFYKSSFENELFIEDDYAALYKNKKLYFLQKLEKDYDEKQIKEFFQNLLNLKSLNYCKASTYEYDYSLKYEFLILVKSNQFKYYLAYLLILCTLFYQINFNKDSKKLDLELLKADAKLSKEDKKFVFLSSYLLLISEKKLNKNINIESLKVEKSILSLEVASNKKEHIYSFFNELSKFSINSISYENSSKKYKSNASLRLYRR